MPSKSMSTMPIHQTKIGDASLKFGPDWLRALSSDNSTGGGGGTGRESTGGGGGWSSGSGGGGGTIGGGERSSNSNHSNYHHHSNHHQSPQYHHQSSRDKDDNRRLSYNSSSVRAEGNSGSGGGGSAVERHPNRFKLSENRYTREELLTLYDKDLNAPQFLPAFGTLFIEKMQPPLAFSQPLEDELRIWHIAQPESSRQGGTGGPGTSPMSGRGIYIPRGRGSGSDRGRGRGRGGGGGYYVPAGRPSEEEERSFSRPRGFERSQSAHEATRWNTAERERNGLGGTGSSPPEEGGTRGGGNWRNRNSDTYGKQRFEESEDGWRRTRWRRDEEDDSFSAGSSRNSNPRRVHRSWSDDGTQDNLPEWAKDSPDDGGAFLDDDRYSAKTNAFEISRRGGGELDKPSKDREVKNDAESHGSQSDRVQKRTPERNDKKSVIVPSLKEEDEGEEADLAVKFQVSTQPPSTATSHRPPTLEPQLDKYDSTNSKGDTHRLKPSQASPPLPQETQKISEEAPSDIEGLQSVLEALTNRQHHSHQQTKHFLHTEEEHYYSMTEEADSLVSKLIEEDASRGLGHTQHRNVGHQVSPQKDSSVLPAPTLQQAAPTHSLPLSPAAPHKGSPDIWFYRDPQGNVQGPFATSEMLLWLNQGYFSALLLLRRECDSVFITLGEMGNLYNRNPFEAGHTTPIPPPLPEPIQSASDQSIQFQRQQQQLLQQNVLREQQQFLLSLIQGQSGVRKDDESWKGGSQVQQPGVNGPQSQGPTPAQIQAQMLLNMVKSAGGEANPIEHLQALFQRQAQEEELFRRKKQEEELLRRKKLEEEKELERKRLFEEEEARKRLEEQQRLELEEQEKKRKAMEERYLLQQKQQAELIKQQHEELARQKEALLQQRQQQELARQRQAEQEHLEQQRQEQQRMEQLRFEKQQQHQRDQLEREEQQRRQQLELEEQKQQQRRLQLEQQQQQQQQKLALEQQQKAALEQQQKAALEQQKFSWNPPPASAPVIIPLSQARSLREIQEEESAKEREENVKLQALKKQQDQQQKLQQQQQQAKTGLSLKWAQNAPPQKTSIKSLAEIQAEEQATVEMVQQNKRERQAIIQHHTQVQQAWSSSLTWANRASLNAPSSGSAPKTNGGVWEDVGKSSKISTSNHSSSSSSGNSTSSNKQSSQKRNKEAEDPFLKMFQDHGVNMVKHQSPSHGHSQAQSHPGDEFTRWCFDTVQVIGGSSVDVPTFISFLKEVESPFEVNDYIRSYLGDGKEAREFGKGFLERRSRWNKARKGKDSEGVNFEDNLCRPASAVNPPTAEFQEVKGKKGKKGKMQKVDTRILGFNTTSAPDRLNVGKRDYGDGTEN